ncbi:plasmid mobilization relaxosome protein MobC [Neorhizobium sp. Rsf11]|uniref:Plasmid mobilization relaxosome protein MobC n=2 Tax=Neorhizobium TaxID=1525371 RepID=A0ABV0MC86_9HYPH|nr:plasmid mobilization relaxosome protein MobC [Neorhizobium petrolearium]WGI72530.1 plasmid mobilization relaxosome protein MobC [Neorhizobium petrolearium]
MAADGGGAVRLGKAEERKERVVHARFSASELTAIEQAAGAAGLTVSAFMRSLTLEGAGVRPFLTDDDRAVFEMLISDMRAIGVNLNQLARAVNGSGRLVEAKLAAELVDVQRLAAAIVLELRSLAGRGARRRRGVV